MSDDKLYVYVEDDVVYVNEEFFCDYTKSNIISMLNDLCRKNHELKKQLQSSKDLVKNKDLQIKLLQDKINAYNSQGKVI